MLSNLLYPITDFFVEVDHRLEINIIDFVSRYSFPTQNAPFLQENMITFLKIAVYSLFLIVPLAILKLLKRESQFVFLLFGLTLVAFVASTFAVFLGFFQLLFI